MRAPGRGILRAQEWRRHSVLLFLVLLLGTAAVSCRSRRTSEPPVASEDAAQMKLKVASLAVQEQVLAAEYSLARNPATYLAVNLSNRSIELRARGRSLRTFGVTEVKRPPRGLALSDVWAMQDKRPLEETERPKIAPGAGEEAANAAAKQALWGPHRMPADYDLICDGGKILEVRALPSGESGSRFGRWARSLYRRTADRLRQWRASGRSESDTMIQLWVSENDARMLFWALPKKLNILILDPPIHR